MATGTFALGVNGAGMSGRISWSTTENVSLNQTTVTATFQVSKASGYSTTSGTFSGYITIDGTQQNFSGSVSIDPGETNTTVFSKSRTVTHAADGTKSVVITADGAVSGTTWSDSYATKSITLTDFSRVPNAPAAPTLVLNTANPMAVDITSAIPADLTPAGPALDDYNYRYSTDNTTWSAEQAMGVDRTETFTSTAPGLYYIQTRAHSSEGWGAWSSSSSITTFSGGKVWNGTAFVPGRTKVWNGTAWVNAIVKVWSGSGWTNAK